VATNMEHIGVGGEVSLGRGAICEAEHHPMGFPIMNSP
jgi:hypothetical protein